MIEFTTKFDSKVNEKLYQIQEQKTKKVWNIFKILFIVLAIIMFLTAFEEYRENDPDYVSSIIIGVFILIFGFTFPILINKLLKKNQNKNNTMSLMNKETEVVYKFDKDMVYIFTTRGKKFRSAVETDYDYFFKVTEDDESYIMYISELQCHVIFKKDITKGTIEEFQSLIQDKFSGLRYERIYDKNK